MSSKLDENHVVWLLKQYSKNQFKTIVVNRLKSGSRLKNHKPNFNNQPDVIKEAK
jgi:hypothetical protein